MDRCRLFAGLVLSGSPLLARASSAPATTAQDARSDAEFLRRARGVNELELRLGRLAAERASTPELRAAGQQMVQKHGELGRQLGDLARQAGAPEKVELSPDQARTVASLQARSGSDFDGQFQRTVDAGHVQELAMYRDEVGRASNPQLRALAAQRVAALQRTVGEAEQRK